MMRSLLCCLLLGLPTAAFAVPPLVTNQGHIKDTNGDALDGDYRMIFRFYETASGATGFISEEVHASVPFVGGSYAVELTSLDETLLNSNGREVYLEIEVQELDTTEIGGPLSPRQRLTSVPYSTLAGRADECGISDRIVGTAPAGPYDIADFDSWDQTFLTVDGNKDAWFQDLAWDGSTLTISDGTGVSINTDDADADPTNEFQDLAWDGSNLTISDGTGVSINTDDADADATNEIQTLNLSGSSLTLSDGGGTVSINDADANASNELQTITQSGNTVTLSDGGGSVSVDDGDSSPTNELQDLSLSGTTVGIENGLGVNLGSTFLSLANGGDVVAPISVQGLDIARPTTYSTAVGWDALNNVTTGRANTAIGNLTLYATTSGEWNTAVGHYALRLNTTGEDNVAVGSLALRSATDPSGNTAVGSEAMRSTTTGSGNVAIGFQALRNQTTGFTNVAVGSEAMETVTTGNQSTAIGRRALRYMTTATRNTAVGYGALQNTTDGQHNTAVGVFAGRYGTIGDNNVFLGYTAGAFAGGDNNVMIGHNVRGDADDDGVTKIKNIVGTTTDNNDAIAVLIDSDGQLGTVSSSARYKRDIRGMGHASQALLSLRPVTFRFKKPYKDGSTPIEYGLIAEDVAEVFPDLVVYNEEGQPETVKYHLLSTLLLNELQKLHAHQQELDYQAELDRAMVDALREQLEDLAERLDPYATSPLEPRTPRERSW